MKYIITLAITAAGMAALWSIIWRRYSICKRVRRRVDEIARK